MNDHRSEPAETIASIECETCVAANTTACADCVVAHLLANDDGPIEFSTVEVVAPTTPAERERNRVVELFAAAGLVDEPVEFVPYDDFVRGAVEPAAPALR